MGRGERAVSKNSGKGPVWKRNLKSDDSDEDYVLEEDEADPQSDELESLVGDASDEESVGGFVDEEDEVLRQVVRSKTLNRSRGRTNKGIRNPKKRKRIAYDDEDDEDYHDDSDDDDDDEFTPDELDFLDEGGLPSPTGRNKKIARHSPKKKGSVKSQKRKTGFRLLTGPQKKKRKGGSKSSKRKRMPVHRKKKAMPCSDSDFAGSELSDHEFTISEEEREQVREASEFCTRLSSNLRSSKKDGEEVAHCQLRKLSRRKGIEKVEEIKNDLEKQGCGICLTEEGKNTVRGTLNCCSHFFCFACIIEWSKVESRCPLCKQRFSTISKPARSATGIDLRGVAIHVPERDQVYQPSEEELRDYVIAYENVICTECHEGGDEALMLLCDLCDSPAHTYCVGLGWEVPEGNWYCEGCRPPSIGFSSPQAQDLMPAQGANNTALNQPSTFENMAYIDLNVTIPETPMTTVSHPVNRFLVSPRQPSNEGFQAAAPVYSMGVSTLSGRRRAHRLQYLLSSNRLDNIAMRLDRTSTPDRTDFSGT